MKQTLVWIGLAIGFVLFMVFSFWADGAKMILKPIVCPDGEYTVTDTSVYRNGRNEAATNTWCEQPGQEPFAIDGYVVGVMFASFLIPAVGFWVLAQIAGIVFPPKPAPQPWESPAP